MSEETMSDKDYYDQDYIVCDLCDGEFYYIEMILFRGNLYCKKCMDEIDADHYADEEKDDE